MMEIRLFQASDAEQIARLFHETVRRINRADYSSEQVEAWAPDHLNFRDWLKVCSDYITYVADDRGLITGFAELGLDGHIDCFYCHKDYQGRGIGRQLYQAIEAKAKQLSLTHLWVEASITAKPFFEKMGFVLIRQQVVSRRGVTFTNFAMEKRLNLSEQDLSSSPSKN